MAFFLLSVALVALGALAYNLQYLGEGMHMAWLNLPEKSTHMGSLGPPLIVRSLFLDGRNIATATAWIFGAAVYLSIAYVTFFYRWKKSPAQ